MHGAPQSPFSSSTVDERQHRQPPFDLSGLSLSRIGPGMVDVGRDGLDAGFLSEAVHSHWMPTATDDGTWASIPAPPEDGYGSLYPAEPLNSDTTGLYPRHTDSLRFGIDGSWAAGTSSAPGLDAFAFSPQANDGQAPCYGSYIDSSSCQRQSNSLSQGSYSSDGGLVVADNPQEAQSLIWSITSPDSTDTQSLSSTADPASAQADRAGRDKAVRKRGRPRLYDEDGTRRERGPPTKPRKPSSAAAIQSPSSGASYLFEPAADQAPVSAASDCHARRADSKDEGDDLARIRARNKIAATRYRQKTQESIARAEEEERIVAGKRQELLACASQLREEVFHLKNELLHQAGCGCPLIQDYLSRAAPTLGAHGGGIQAYAGHTSPGPPPQPLVGEGEVVHAAGCLVGGLPQASTPEGYQSHHLP